MTSAFKVGSLLVSTANLPFQHGILSNSGGMVGASSVSSWTTIAVAGGGGRDLLTIFATAAGGGVNGVYVEEDSSVVLE